MAAGRGALTLAIGGLVFVWLASAPLAQRAADADAALEVLPVQGGVHLIGTERGNVTVHVSEEGVLLVDSGAAADTDAILAAVRRISPEPIRFIINTSSAAEHVAGNAALAAAGENLSRPVGAEAALRPRGASILAHEHVLGRMSAESNAPGALPFAAWPTETYFTARRTLSFGAEPIEIIHAPGAHSDGDSIVFFRKADVISAGDIIDMTRYPVIDVRRGGTIQGTVDALNRIIELTIPRFNQMGGTRVVPGRGRITDEADVVEYRDMMTIIRDRIAGLVARGAPVEEVIAARPTLDYDGLYGAAAGPWTTRSFVEAVYRSLKEIARAQP
jgi:glyoxylase-like metal-dependent hydrolase (beta-lactamase superfamily II)